jgi:hypothetical protein
MRSWNKPFGTFLDGIFTKLRDAAPWARGRRAALCYNSVAVIFSEDSDAMQVAETVLFAGIALA